MNHDSADANPTTDVMAVVYFDTAFVLKCYVSERGSLDVRRAASMADQLVTSDLCRAEFAAAVHRKRRERQLTKREAEIVLEQFARDARSRVWEFIPVSHAVVERACDVLGSLPATVMLRSADAIHCATAAELGLSTIYSNDKYLLNGASYFGLRGVNVIEDGHAES